MSSADSRRRRSQLPRVSQSQKDAEKDDKIIRLTIKNMPFSANDHQFSCKCHIFFRLNYRYTHQQTSIHTTLCSPSRVICDAAMDLRLIFTNMLTKGMLIDWVKVSQSVHQYPLQAVASIDTIQSLTDNKLHQTECHWLINWVRFLHHTQHKIGHFGDFPTISLLAYCWKTKSITTKANMHPQQNIPQPR